MRQEVSIGLTQDTSGAHDPPHHVPGYEGTPSTVPVQSSTLPTFPPNRPFPQYPDSRARPLLAFLALHIYIYIHICVSVILKKYYLVPDGG